MRNISYLIDRAKYNSTIMFKLFNKRINKVETAAPPNSSVSDKSLQTIAFPYGHSASLITIAPEENPKQVVEKLSITPPSALITISGDTEGLDEQMQLRLTQLFSRGVARAAADTDAMLMDNGKAAGLAALTGQGVTDRGRKSRLVGVAPVTQVTYPGQSETPTTSDALPLEPNHSHFVLVDSQERGREIEVMYNLAAALATDKPALTILINGGEQSRAEILRSVRLGWPILIFSGTGQLADEIVTLHQNPPDFIADPALAEMIAEGHILVFPIDGQVEELERLIQRQFRGDGLLKLAWEQFAVYDQNANRQQKTFQRLQFLIIVMGVLGTLLALFQASLDLEIRQTTQIVDLQEVVDDSQQGCEPALNKLNEIKKSSSWFANFLATHSYLMFFIEYLVEFLQYVIVAIPVLVTVLIAVASRFNAGQKWVLLRSNAETIKSEIFQYRALADVYNAERCVDTCRESQLADKMQTISHSLIQTEANMSALKPYKGPLPPRYGTAENDDGFSALSPERYLDTRLEDQLNYYVKKTIQLERQWSRWQWAIYLLGGTGTLLAARGQELWIALTTGMVAAITNYLAYQQVQERLTKYNQTATRLAHVRNWWTALSAAEQAKQANIDKLVVDTEGVLEDEFKSWMLQMEETMSVLKEEQAKAAEKAQAKVSIEPEMVKPVAGQPPKGLESFKEHFIKPESSDNNIDSKT